MNLKTAALRLGVHYQTAYRWVRSGQLVAVKVGAGYEISDAAVERLQAQRTATERVPERAEPLFTGSAGRASASSAAVEGLAMRSAVSNSLDVLDRMVDAVTLDATAVAERAARVAAENLGDSAFLYRISSDDEMAAVYAAHRDPVSEVAASTLGRDTRTGTTLVRRCITTGQRICVPQVPQRELRRLLHPELHEHLQLSGCYSALCVPIGNDGALLVTRDLPGQPYTNDDLEFVESIVARVATADERARSWAGAWEMRRAMVVAFQAPTFDGGCFDSLTGPDGAEPVVAVLDTALDHVAGSKAYAALMGVEFTELPGMSLRSIVRDGGALDEALAPVLLGEFDFRSVELDVLADQRRVALHLALVRRDDATPRGVVVVAHAVPPLSGG